MSKTSNKNIDKYNIKKYYYPKEIPQFILEKLLQSARIYLEQPIKKEFITASAYFNDTKRDATKFVAEKAGLEILLIINEPKDIFLAYELETKLAKNGKTTNTFMDTTKSTIQIYDKNKGDNKDGDDDDDKFIIVFDLRGGTLVLLY